MRLFLVVLQELHRLLRCLQLLLLFSRCMPSFVLIGCCVNELHGHLCPYRNVFTEAVYCCFTRITFLYQIVYMFVLPELEVAIASPSFVI